MKAIVLGSAKCVDDDLVEALLMFKPDMFIGVNHIGLRYEHIDAWCSCHADDMMDRWVPQRRSLGWPVPPLWSTPRHAARLGIGAASYWEGSSGALGVEVARLAGCTKIVLCGVPLRNGPHFYEGDDFTWEVHYQRRWTEKLPDLRKTVRSMSGWTAEQLGRPTREWLDSSPAD